MLSTIYWGLYWGLLFIASILNPKNIPMNLGKPHGPCTGNCRGRSVAEKAYCGLRSRFVVGKGIRDRDLAFLTSHVQGLGFMGLGLKGIRGLGV